MRILLVVCYFYIRLVLNEGSGLIVTMAQRPVVDNFPDREDPAYLKFLEQSFLASKEIEHKETASTDFILKRLSELELKVNSEERRVTHGLAAGAGVQVGMAGQAGGVLGKAVGGGCIW